MVNLAVIGIGRMGGVHARNLFKGRVKGAKLVAVCDIDENKLKPYEAPYVEVYTDYKAMIDVVKPDGVIIATPHPSHAEIAKYCLAAGVNTLLEKPLTVTTAEAKDLLEYAADKEAFLQIMYNQRTNPVYVKAKQLIDGGALGEIRRANYIITDWYRSQAYYDQGGWRASWSGEGGGTLINQCIHQLDLICWLLGTPQTVRAECRTVGRNISTENDVTALLGYDGFNLSFSASTHELHGVNRLEIAGDKGRLVVEKGKMTYVLFDKSEPQVNAETRAGYGSTGAKKRVYRYKLSRLIPDLIYGQQRNIIKNFAAAIAGKEAVYTPATEGLKALELINGAYMSSWTGETVTLPLPDDAYEAMLRQKIKEEINHKE